MSDLNPTEIYRKYQRKELDKAVAVAYLKSFIESSNDEDLRVQAVDLLGEMDLDVGEVFKFLEYILTSEIEVKVRGTVAELIIQKYLEQGEKTILWCFNNEKSLDCLLVIFRSLQIQKNQISKSLIKSMELILGKEYIYDHGIMPREAMALKFLEMIVNFKILDERKFPNPHHVHVSYRVKNRHVISLSINEVECNELIFLDMFPYLKILSISIAYLKKIDGFYNLKILEYLDLHANDLWELPSLEGLIKLRKLIIDTNPISKLNGIEKLKQITEIELYKTYIPHPEREKIKNHIISNRKTLEKDKQKLILFGRNCNRNKQFKEAINAFEKAIKFNFGFPIYYNLSCEEWLELTNLYLTVGNHYKALKACLNCLKRDSTIKEAQILRKEIINLMKKKKKYT